MTSVNRNRSKSRSKKSKSSIETDEQIDQIIKDITLKRPRNPTCADKWKKMKEGEKKKYSKLYEDEKVKYKSDLELVKHYLFRDFNDTVYRSPTAYRIFLNEKLREGFDQGLDPKDVRKEAGNTWARMTEEEKKVYVR